jgi:uncharacterized protein YrrD
VAARRTPTADWRLEIRPGTPVISGNDQVGTVQRLILRPDGSAEGLIISGWLMLGHDVHVPIEAVESADPDAVHLSISLAELSRLPPLDRDAEQEPADGGGGATSLARASFLRSSASGQAEAAAGGWPLRAGQRVAATDGDAGELDVVLIDPRTDRATGFVVRKGRFIVRDVIVPIDWVQSVTRDRITLSVPKARLDGLPEYRPDEEITRDVLDALWYRSGLGPADLQFVDVRTRGGIVELSGHTHTEHTREEIERVAREVRGVLDVRNYLDTYEALEEAVRAAQRAARQPADPP